MYVDQMARFEKLVAGSGVLLYRNDIPLYYLRESLFRHRWNRFVQALGPLKAIYVWHKNVLRVQMEGLVFQENVDDPFDCVLLDWWTV